MSTKSLLKIFPYLELVYYEGFKFSPEKYNTYDKSGNRYSNFSINFSADKKFNLDENVILKEGYISSIMIYLQN